MSSKLDAAIRFPDQNPNPVLRMDDAGTLVYHNPASRPIVEGFQLALGTALPEGLLAQLRRALASAGAHAAEVEVARRTYALTPVAAPGFGFVNIYATDITANRAVERFPERNPNPVFRIDGEDRLIYANPAGAPLVSALGLAVGAPLPGDLARRLRAAESAGGDEPIELQAGARWYELTSVPIPEFGFSNVYGKDVTALKALDRFPGQNPNPVLRVSRDGRLVFANAASEPILRGLGMALREVVPESFIERMGGGPDEHAESVFDIEASGRVFRLVAVPAFEFDFTNVYGTDITAARQVEAAHRENERLLLNILPGPIAARLRGGERIIADRHEDLSLLFADIVGFTQMSSSLSPAEVIDLLDGLFRSLDDLVDHFRLEKIKTIGDAYMVVGGLPPDIDDHLARVASMALDLRKTLHARPGTQPISMRIGLHAGPAVAGVIGARKFIYDVWGGTVNMASRLESYGVPDAIQVSDVVRERLEDRFDFELRGVLDLKGMGPTRTWFLRGRKGETLSGRRARSGRAQASAASSQSSPAPSASSG